MTKKQMLDLMRLLSALESWAMSRSERLPSYLHEQIANSTEALEGYILESKGVRNGELVPPNAEIRGGEAVPLD